jgi:serine/threonine protein phosphatase PrpC
MWKIASAKSIGTSHLRSQVPCQDAFATTKLSNPHNGEGVFFVISDGAGSAKHAELASKTVCELAIQMAKDSDTKNPLDIGLLNNIADKANQYLGYIADLYECEIRHFSCTMLMLAIWRDSAICYQIGDGAIAIKENKSWKLLTKPEKSEFANTTTFLVSKNRKDSEQICQLQGDFTACCGFTDGLERLAIDFKTDTAHNAFFDFIVNNVSKNGSEEKTSSALEGFLDSEVINRKTDDDKTVVASVWLE